jgi:hypothetical protein
MHCDDCKQAIEIHPLAPALPLESTERWVCPSCAHHPSPGRSSQLVFDATPPLSGSTQRPSRTRASARIARAANPDAAAISPKTINSKKTASARSALFCGPTTPEAGGGIPEQTPSSPSSPKELLQGNTKCRRDSLAPATPAQAESKDAPWFNLMDRAKVQAVRDVLQVSLLRN